MPIGFDPKDTFTFIFPGEEGTARKERKPVFRYLTGREDLALSKAYKAATQRDNDDFIIDIARALGVGFVGLEGDPQSDNPAEALLEHFTLADMMDIAQNIVAQQMIAEIDKKKSARQLQSATAQSAPGAGEANA